MNIRKSIDYSTLYAELNKVLSENLPQMEEIHAIGRAICKRQEKGAAVAASEFLQANNPDRSGFSPRNVRRMWDFYRTYENDEVILRLAMKIGWTLNVVIMEAALTRDERRWYLEQAQEQQWSKSVLLEKLASAAHLEKSLDTATDTCYTNKKEKDSALHRFATIASQLQPAQSLSYIPAVPVYNMLLHFTRRSRQSPLHVRC